MGSLTPAHVWVSVWADRACWVDTSASDERVGCWVKAGLLPYSGSFFLLINFYNFFGHIGSLLLCRVSLVVKTGGHLYCSAQASHGSGFSFCRASALGMWASVVVVHSWVSLQHMGSSWTHDWTSVPHTGRQILNHWITREVPLQWVLCGFLEGAQGDWTIAAQGRDPH